MDLGIPTLEPLPPPSPDIPPSRPQTIFLHVLSPSLEVPNKLRFPSVPISTTVGELKIKIQDAIATKPVPGRQRLIYRGKALVKDTDTMKDVFGQDAVREPAPRKSPSYLTDPTQINDPVAHSLHLVLPPSNLTAPSAQASTTASNPQPINAPSQNTSLSPRLASEDRLPPLAPNPAEVGDRSQPTVVRGGFQGHPPHAHHVHHDMAHPQGHIPQHIQAAINSHFAAMSQQLGQQLAMGAMTPPGIPSHSTPNNVRQFATQAQPTFQQVITQQQQARAAAGRQGLSEIPTADLTNAGSNLQAQARTPDRVTPMLPQITSGVMNTPNPEGQGQNSPHWRIIVNENTVTVPAPVVGGNNMAGIPVPSLAPHGSFNVPAEALATSVAGQRTSIPQPQSPTSYLPAQGLESPIWLWTMIQTMQQRLSTLERMATAGTVPSDHQIQEVRSQLNDIMRYRNAFTESLRSTSNSRLAYISRMAAMTARNAPTNATVTDNIPPVATSIPNSATPMVYLLSSPSGPYALLVSPLGLYSSAHRSLTVPDASHLPTTTPQQQHFQQPQLPHQDADVGGPQPAVQPPLHAQPVHEPHAQARDIARILLPLGGHLWLLVRLFGFVYFFTAGAGWRRTIVLGVAAFLVFIAQTGIFRPFQQAILEPVRRHLEGLLPLAGNDRRDVGGAPGGLPAAGVGGEGRPVVEPDVRQAAERLLRAREQRDLGVIRHYLRSFERAMAIFFASLVPGIGERHIAARDAAWAVRLAELEREGDEVRREGVPEVHGDTGPGQRGSSPSTETNNRNEDDNGVGQPQRTQQGQPPVVEI
ncbi:hypothetical protein MMC16_005372 [Acarospora aff. strigata]|nr:hypothetical protein [Acarospora aff. strigata]